MTTRHEAEKEAMELAGFEKKDIVLMTKFSPVPFSEEILKNMNFVYDKNSILWRYDSVEGIWKPNAEKYLRSVIRNKLLGDEQQKKNYVEEIVAHIRDTQLNESFELDNDPYLIGFKNGVFSLKTNCLEQFHPDQRITNKLDLEIDPQITECPAIDKFFEGCVGKEYKSVLYDLFSYCLFKRYPYAKLFFIYGPASTGKSKLLELLEKFLGSENYCSVEPQDIQKDPHATAQMQYKMANIVSDINYDALDNINQVKKITGEDTVKIRSMYKNPYNGKLFAKQIFSTNQLPNVKEKTRAWYRRVYTIECSNIIPKENQDRFLMEKLTTSSELKGLANKCLMNLKELKKHNFTFSYDIDENEMAKVYEQLSNPILMFIEQSCVKERSKFVFQWEFKERFKNWLQINHFPPVSNPQINEYMNESFTNSNRDSFNGDKKYRVWVGLDWKSSHNPSLLNQFNHFNQVCKKVYMYRESFTDPCKLVKLVKDEFPQETEVKNERN